MWHNIWNIILTLVFAGLVVFSTRSLIKEIRKKQLERQEKKERKPQAGKRAIKPYLSAHRPTKKPIHHR
jgi:phosphotransferase system  glucose/maltose/N-acetylglucosamine-specific IIC component